MHFVLVAKRVLSNYCILHDRTQAYKFFVVYGLSFCATERNQIGFIMINVVRWSQALFFPCGYSVVPELLC